MALTKLKPLTIRNRDYGDEPIYDWSYTIAVSVDAEGRFLFDFPGEIRDCLYALVAKSDQIGELRAGAVHFQQVRGGMRLLASKTLEAGRAALEMAARDNAKEAVVRERIIVYGLRSRSQYTKGDDGQLFPEPGFPGADAAGARLWSGRAGRESSVGDMDGRLGINAYYYVGFVARVYDRITRVKGAHKEFKLELPDPQEFSYENPAYRLNAFKDVDIEESELHRFTVMPYSDEAATFFYDVMLSICKLSDRLDGFFGNHENVMKAIAAGGPFRLAPPQQDKA